MVTSQLIINKLGNYDAIVTATLAADKVGKLDHYEVISLKNTTLEAAKAFLVKQGVEPEEINFAIQQLEENGHDMADFGMFGSFVTSQFTGTLQ